MYVQTHIKRRSSSTFWFSIYFREICAKEFALYFEQPRWENIVLQAAHAEPCIRHIALSLGALSRHRYQPNFLAGSQQPDSLLSYGLMQYSLAIQVLNERLATSPQRYELAVLASIMFVAIEALQEHQNQVQMLLDSIFYVLERSFPSTSISTTPQDASNISTLPVMPVLDQSLWRTTPELDQLIYSLSQIRLQYRLLSS